MSRETMSWKYRLQISVAPICLCLVASFHLARVFYCDQSPWKGGGFGMFSTVDSPAARFTRVYLVDGDRRIPVAVPESLNLLENRLRAAPSQAGIREFAIALSELNWVYKDHRWHALAQQRMSAKPYEPVGGKQLSQSRHVAWATPEDLPRVIGVAGRKLGDPSKYLSPDAIHVELWRYRFHAKTSSLKAERMIVTEQQLKRDEQWLVDAQ